MLPLIAFLLIDSEGSSIKRQRTLKKYASINAHKCDFYTLHAPNQFSDLIERRKEKEKKEDAHQIQSIQ